MHCGQRLPQVCPNCGTQNPGEARFCFHCGHNLAEPAPGKAESRMPAALSEKLVAARSAGAMEGERRVVTMLFCDVTGSTAAAGRLDPEEWREIINGAFERMIEPVYRYEGTLARLMGDAILAFFGAPIAHEDDPERAIRAGLDIVRELAPYWEAVEKRWGVSADVRVGINTGLVVVGAVGSDLKMEYSALGDAINLAARMEQTAMPGTVQVAEETHRLAAPLFEWEDLGTQEIRGKPDPVRTYRPLAPRAKPGRLRGIDGLDAPMVGRDAELVQLEQALARVRNGSGGIVFIAGEAGLGKSRLIAEGRRLWMETDPGRGAPPWWVERRATSYETNMAYGLIKMQLRLYCGLEDGLTAAQARSRLSEWSAGLDIAVRAQVEGIFARVLGLQENGAGESLKGEAFRNRFFAAMDAYFEWLYGRQPGVLVLDDLHWADSASVALIAHLLRRVDTLPVLYICASRPDRESPGWSLLGEAENRYPHRFTRIELVPLSAADSDSLVDSLLTVSELPDSLRRRIQDRADGNPFFVEEIVRSLIDEEVVRRQGQAWVVGQEIEKIEIPDNVQSLLAARIDRLESETRHVLQLASVIGRSFYYRVLQQIAEARPALKSHLADLQRAQMILEAGRRPELAYMFRHALTQETAYRSILRQQRRVFHSRVAKALEMLFPDQLDEHAALLAIHYEQAEAPEKAWPYYRLAGDAAFRLYANSEAAGHYARALALGGRAGAPAPTLRHLFKRRGRALELEGQFESALAHYEGMVDWAEEHAEPAIELEGVIAQAIVRCTPTSHFDFEIGKVLVGRAFSLAERLGDQASAAKIHWIEMNRQRLKGSLAAALEQGELSLALSEKLGLAEQRAQTLHDLGYVYSELGRVNKSIESFEEAAAFWRETGNLLMLADNLSGSTISYYLKGDFDTTLEKSDEAYSITQKVKNLWGQAFSQMNIGFSLRERGEYAEALRRIDLSIALGKESGFPVPYYFGRFQKSIVYGDLGMHDEGLRIAQEIYDYEGSNPFSETRLMSDVARIFHLTHLGRLDEAQEILEISRTMISPEHTWYFTYLGGIELLLILRRDEPKKALGLSEKHIEKAVEFGVDAMRAELLFYRAEALYGLGKPEQALEALSDALSICKKFNQRRMTWRVQGQRARLLREKGVETEARNALENALETIRTIAEFVPEEFRASFLATEEVRAVLKAK